MASINYATREISCKIVYYGPGLSGKTTNLQIIHRKIPDKDKSEMVSLATETDRTLFFDFLPLDLGSIKGFSTKFQLYTVPGQVYYNATRKLVLRGVDGVVFVVDSQTDKIQENVESFTNLQENLREYGHAIEAIPLVLQYNKRDLPNVYPVQQLNDLFNKWNLPYCEAVAATGVGVFTTLKAIGKLVIDRFNAKYAGFQGAGRRMQPGQRMQPPPTSPAPSPSRGDMRPLPTSPFGSPTGMPGGPRTPAQGPAGFAPPPRENPFASAPPSFSPGAPGPGHPPFMIPTPFQTPPGNAPSPAGGFAPPPPPAPNYPGGGFAAGPAPYPGSNAPFPPPGNMPPPGGSPAPGGMPSRPGFPSAPGPSPGQGNIPVSPFLDSFAGPRPAAPLGNPGPIPGLQTSNPFAGQRPPPPPFPAFGGAPQPQQPPPPPYPGGPFAPGNMPSMGGPTPFPAPNTPFPPTRPNEPEVAPPPPPPGGLRNSFDDASGIVSTYEDVQRNENFKTKKLPLPGEKKKGLFDGFFRKDK